MRRLSEDREGFRRRFTVLKTDLSLGYTFRKYDAVMYGGMEKTMSRLAIITDSNSGITQSRGKELGIFVLPMPFFIDGQLFLEDITLTQEQFYDRLGGDSDISTSQPSPGDVMELWENVLKDYDEIVHANNLVLVEGVKNND